MFGVFCRDSLMKVIVPDGLFIGDRYIGYIYELVYAGKGRGLFAIMVMVLALGGLQRERLHRTVGFTLALPVSRAQLVSAQALLGLVLVAVLSALPLLLLTVCSPLTHVSYPLEQMTRFGLLWFVSGAVFFAVAFLASTLFGSEYAALAVSFVFMIFYPIATLFPPLNRLPLNIHHIMSGMAMPYFDGPHALLVGTPPWTLLASMLAIAGLLIATAVQITKRRDYP
ncbi:ABC transporter permease subunit [Dyella caseinilytica]|uniref:ABC transporter permease subunit n=1 Tax=Dyella caseinilytica TaxID=1849581 RepID=A0ABX7GW65_9GAMM|nr:ABC transporter permease subunit [Dyella caseinilytica]QRN54298.1 ABC transporter permease subunit [Dyella caseinilytica]